MISDKEYVESVQWLIKKNHIVVSDLDTYIQLDNTIIPSWLRMVNTFWANDEINDDDYVPTIKFLAKISTTELLQTVHDTNQTIDFLERDFPGYSPLFRTFAYQKDLVVDSVGILTSYTTQFELKPELMDVYNEIGSFDNNHKTVVVIPIFTSSAYWDPGFYTYFNGECDSSCLTTKIEYEKGLTANASDKAVGVLRLLGYDLITDIDLDKNPEILQRK